MKVNASNELKSRLAHAAENGSVIARDILAELKKNVDVTEIVRGFYNHFSTKRKRTSCDGFQKIRIVFTACNKDLSNEHFPDRNNPHAPLFPENRVDMEPSTFVKLFKNLPEYPETEVSYFASAICVDSKVTVRLLEGLQNIYEAYDGNNYSPIADDTASTLHSSCMRYPDKARNAADFYANFAGVKILVARDESNNVLGRAIVWEHVRCPGNDYGLDTVSLTDRIYSSHAFVIGMMQNEARRIGILLRRKVNDYIHTKEYVALNSLQEKGIVAGQELQLALIVDVPAFRWHKKGVPYMDTFYSIAMKAGKIELRNYEGNGQIATCRNTGGSAVRTMQVCLGCGKIHGDFGNVFCSSCKSSLYASTVFGEVIKGTVRDYKGEVYPSVLFKKGRPIPTFRTYLQLEKLFMS